MRANNTHHLKAAAHARHDAARRRALETLDHLETQDQPLTIAGVARNAGVARSWIYTQPDILSRIRTATPRPQPSPTHTSQPSWQRRLELAHQRIKELTEENQQLRHQLALAHGQRRANTTNRTPSTTQNTWSTPT